MDRIDKINLKELSSTGFELEFEDERKAKLAYLQLQVQLNDCMMIRQELTTIIMEERTNTRGGFDQAHGRYKIFNTVINQTIKLIDLFEEAIEMKLTLVKKGKKVAEKTDKMNDKITRRKGLEADNDQLRQEISKLQENLHANRDTNNKREKELGKKKSDDVDEKMKHKELTNIVHRAQSNQKLLTETLTKSFAELETSVNEAAQ